MIEIFLPYMTECIYITLVKIGNCTYKILSCSVKRLFCGRKSAVQADNFSHSLSSSINFPTYMFFLVSSINFHTDTALVIHSVIYQKIFLRLYSLLNVVFFFYFLFLFIQLSLTWLLSIFCNFGAPQRSHTGFDNVIRSLEHWREYTLVTAESLSHWSCENDQWIEINDVLKRLSGIGKIWELLSLIL